MYGRKVIPTGVFFLIGIISLVFCVGNIYAQEPGIPGDQVFNPGHSYGSKVTLNEGETKIVSIPVEVPSGYTRDDFFNGLVVNKTAGPNWVKLNGVVGGSIQIIVGPHTFGGSTSGDQKYTAVFTLGSKRGSSGARITLTIVVLDEVTFVCTEPQETWISSSILYTFDVRSCFTGCSDCTVVLKQESGQRTGHHRVGGGGSSTPATTWLSMSLGGTQLSGFPTSLGGHTVKLAAVKDGEEVKEGSFVLTVKKAKCADKYADPNNDNHEPCIAGSVLVAGSHAACSGSNATEAWKCKTPISVTEGLASCSAECEQAECGDDYDENPCGEGSTLATGSHAACSDSNTTETWSCVLNSDTNAGLKECSADCPVDGKCGTLQRDATDTVIPSSLCAAGDTKDLTDKAETLLGCFCRQNLGTYDTGKTWQCAGKGGGDDSDTCTAGEYCSEGSGFRGGCKGVNSCTCDVAPLNPTGDPYQCPGYPSGVGGTRDCDRGTNQGGGALSKSVTIRIRSEPNPDPPADGNRVKSITFKAIDNYLINATSWKVGKMYEHQTCGEGAYVWGSTSMGGYTEGYPITFNKERDNNFKLCFASRKDDDNIDYESPIYELIIDTTVETTTTLNISGDGVRVRGQTDPGSSIRFSAYGNGTSLGQEVPLIVGDDGLWEISIPGVGSPATDIKFVGYVEITDPLGNENSDMVEGVISCEEYASCEVEDTKITRVNQKNAACNYNTRSCNSGFTELQGGGTLINGREWTCQEDATAKEEQCVVCNAGFVHKPGAGLGECIPKATGADCVPPSKTETSSDLSNCGATRSQRNSGYPNCSWGAWDPWSGGTTCASDQRCANGSCVGGRGGGGVGGNNNGGNNNGANALTNPHLPPSANPSSFTIEAEEADKSYISEGESIKWIVKRRPGVTEKGFTVECEEKGTWGATPLEYAKSAGTTGSFTMKTTDDDIPEPPGSITCSVLSSGSAARDTYSVRIVSDDQIKKSNLIIDCSFGPDQDAEGRAREECGIEHLFELANNIMRLLLWLAITGAGILIFYRGAVLAINVFVKGGDQEARKKVQDALRAVLFGLIFILSAYLIVNAGFNIIGYNLGDPFKWDESKLPDIGGDGSSTGGTAGQQTTGGAGNGNVEPPDNEPTTETAECTQRAGEQIVDCICTNCSVPGGVPFKENNKAYNKVHTELGSNLQRLKNKTSNLTSPLYWTVTEAWPPKASRGHSADCHYVGTCVDIGFRDASGNKIGYTLGDIQAFAQKAKESGLVVVFETNNESLKNDIIAAGGIQALYDPGYVDHFSVYDCSLQFPPTNHC